MISILTSIKKLLGIAEEYEQFDVDIIMHINSIFMILHQMGIGPDECFVIHDKTETWEDFIPISSKLEAVRSLVYLRVKLLFDPPIGSTLESINNTIKELEWRLYVSEDLDNNEER